MLPRTQAASAMWWNPDGSPSLALLAQFGEQIGGARLIQQWYTISLRACEFRSARWRWRLRNRRLPRPISLKTTSMRSGKFNASLDEVNDRVVPVLNDISGQQIGADSAEWQKWFNNLVGFNSLQASEPPTITEEVPLAYQPQPIPLGSFVTPIHVVRMSCFGPGTMVRTLNGQAPIESLKVGDQVLTQNVKTGAWPISRSLSFITIRPARPIKSSSAPRRSSAAISTDSGRPAQAG